MNIVGVRIKEITCWKFLLTFPSLDDKKKFNLQSVRDWVSNFREPHYEDVFFERKVAVEIRGHPIHAWSEDNLKLIVKNVGDWGWWINHLDSSKELETPRVCCYTSVLGKIDKSEQVKLGKVFHLIKLIEVDWDFSKINSVFKIFQRIQLKKIRIAVKKSIFSKKRVIQRLQQRKGRILQ